MKKIFLILLGFLILPSYALGADWTFTQVGNTVEYTVSEAGAGAMIGTSGTVINGFGDGFNLVFDITNTSDWTFDGSGTYKLYDQTEVFTNDCNIGETESTCSGAGASFIRNLYVTETGIFLTEQSEGEDNSTIVGIINEATSGFASTTGFQLSGVISWVSDSLIKVYLGTAVGIIYQLRYWIAVFAVFGVILFFSKRGFIFFRH